MDNLELKQRKPNRLKGYDYSQNGAYFITICVKDRHEMLGKIIVGDDAIAPQVILSQYGMVADKYISGIQGIDKFVIMPNHVHMIICTNVYDETPNPCTSMALASPTQSVSQLVKTFKTLVSKGLGFSLWQRSFHDHIIRNEQEYREIWEYIDTNPLKWQKDCFNPINIGL